MILTAVLALAVFCVFAFKAKTEQVRGAADLVALSAAEDPDNACARAKQTAAANNVRLESCKETGDVFDYVVTVTVQGDFDWWGMWAIGATSHAGRLGV
jgi:secretion/DNA translocation related TadE-like protein